MRHRIEHNRTLLFNHVGKLPQHGLSSQICLSAFGFSVRALSVCQRCRLCCEHVYCLSVRASPFVARFCRAFSSKPGFVFSVLVSEWNHIKYVLRIGTGYSVSIEFLFNERVACCQFGTKHIFLWLFKATYGNAHAGVNLYFASNCLAARVDVNIVKTGEKAESLYYVLTTSKSRSSTGTPLLYDWTWDNAGCHVKWNDMQHAVLSSAVRLILRL